MASLIRRGEEKDGPYPTVLEKVERKKEKAGIYLRRVLVTALKKRDTFGVCRRRFGFNKEREAR